MSREEQEEWDNAEGARAAKVRESEELKIKNDPFRVADFADFIPPDAF